MERITFEQLLEKFDKSVHPQLQKQWERNDVTHYVVFENLDMCSSRFGERTAMIVGPDCTYKTIESVEGKWLNDLPSQRQYAVAYAAK